MIDKLPIIERLHDEKNIHFSEVNLCKEAADIIADIMRENAELKAHPLKMICEKCGVLTDVDLPNKDSDISTKPSEET